MNLVLYITYGLQKNKLINFSLDTLFKLFTNKGAKISNNATVIQQKEMYSSNIPSTKE